jgi:Flp pilus assembly protein TadB
MLTRVLYGLLALLVIVIGAIVWVSLFVTMRRDRRVFREDRRLAAERDALAARAGDDPVRS